MKRVKVAILRARHDQAVAEISDAACIAMLMNNPNRTGVLQYWESVTGGFLDFVDSVLFPWVLIEMDATDVARETQVERAIAATQALPNADIDSFDIVVVLTHPGQLTIANPKASMPGEPATMIKNFDGGAGGGAGSKAACALPVMTSNHTFMCHELGHTLGFQHSYGVLNNGADWDGLAPFFQGEVYGDPYDIMSSASFGSRWLDPKVTHYSGDPVFTGHAVAGWPNPAAIRMGPPPARAHVHLWDPSAIQDSLVRHMTMPSQGSLRFDLVPALGGKAGVQLVALHPAGEDADGRGRVYLEYRQRGGWDAGLDVSGNDLSRQAVVVHALADTAEGVRCWYRGRILVPVELDSDLKVAGTPLTVRVVDASAEDGGFAQVEVSLGSGAEVEIQVRSRDVVVAEVNPEPMLTPCGDKITHMTRLLVTETQYLPTSFGLGGEGAPDAALKATWTLSGVVVPEGAGSLNVPTSEGEFSIDYFRHPLTAELRLTSGGGVRYRVDLVCTISEGDGTGAKTAVATFAPPGWRDGYSPADTAALEKCLLKYAKSARLRPRDFLIPHGPNPIEREMVDQINQRRLQLMIDQVATSHPGPAAALGAISAMRFGRQ